MKKDTVQSNKIAMELLLTKNPLVSTLKLHSTKDVVPSFIDKATNINIATGFITNDSIAELKSIVEYKSDNFKLNLFIGMNYLDGFTRIQYNAVKELDKLISQKEAGSIFLSPKALFHGKMYSFLNGNSCLGSFVGSSNLGSFLDKNANYIEADILFKGEEASILDSHIGYIIKSLGIPFGEIDQIVSFKEPEQQVLKGYDHVEKVTNNYIDTLKRKKTGKVARMRFKTDPKSNLNTYFGAGKIKNRYSPRGWYEVELILGKKTEAATLLPVNGPFTVVTQDGYSFKLSRQGDYNKNLRSESNLKILGRWIKGHMENEGALQIGEPVTEDTISKFGKSHLVFEETTDGVWLLSME